jgi:hypothetical protein
MFKRPFTAICQKHGQTKAIAIDVPDGKDKALEAAMEQLPDQDIVALIPGQHAPNIYTYDAGAGKEKTDPDPGGPWPTNLPPGF